MDLPKRIAENLIDATSTTTWGYSKKKLKPGASSVILAEAKVYFKGLGWKVKKTTKNDFFMARKPKAPTKIRFQIGTHPAIELYSKTASGGWKIIAKIAKYTYGEVKKFKSLQEMVDHSETIKAPIMITKGTLPDPHEFGAFTIGIRKDYYGIKQAVLMNQVFTCYVESVVALNQDGSITDSIHVVAAPGEQVWFHFNCCSPTGATFDIISDGETFYPVKRYGKKRLTSEMKPKKGIDLNHMNKSDEMMINGAIQLFLDPSEDDE